MVSTPMRMRSCPLSASRRVTVAGPSNDLVASVPGASPSSAAWTSIAWLPARLRLFANTRVISSTPAARAVATPSAPATLSPATSRSKTTWLWSTRRITSSRGLLVAVHPDRQLCPCPQVQGDALERRGCRDGLPALYFLPGPGIGPGRICRQIDYPLACALVQYGRHQQIRPEHELVVHHLTDGIGREIVKQRAHGRRAVFAGAPHLFHDVGPQPLTQEQQLPDDGVGRLTEGPGFVRAAQRDGIVDGRCAVAMQAEDWAEDAILEPAHDQLAEPRVLRVAVEKAADVRRPPGDAAQTHVQPGRYL